MLDIKTERQRLRGQAARMAAALGAKDIRHSDRAILRQVLALAEYRAARVVFTYVSVGRETDTRALIGAALAAGKTVCVPRCLGGGVMEARQITSPDALRPTRMGLLEPDGTAPLIVAGQIGLILAPCLAADRAGTRLGQGGGYYDRFLPQTACPVACLCRGPLVWEALPRAPWDAPVGIIITEDEVIRAHR